MTKKTKRVYKAPALEKGLEIIELLATRQIPMSMTEIANSLGRSGNEIFRMLSVLEQRKYIRKRDGEKYGITNHLFDLGMRVPPNATLIELLVPRMRQLADEIRQSCHLSVVSGKHIVVIARVENPAPVGFSVRVGTGRGLIESASGRVFLAFMNEKDRENAIAAIVKKARPKPGIDALRSELDDIRERGYLKSPSTYITAITDICVPVIAGARTGIVATLTVPFASGSDAPFSLNETVGKVLKGVQEMSRHAAVLGGF